MDEIVLTTANIKKQKIISDKGESIDFFNVCIGAPSGRTVDIATKTIIAPQKEQVVVVQPVIPEKQPGENVTQPSAPAQQGGFVRQLLQDLDEEEADSFLPIQRGGFVNNLLEDSATSENLEICKV